MRFVRGFFEGGFSGFGVCGWYFRMRKSSGGRTKSRRERRSVKDSVLWRLKRRKPGANVPRPKSVQIVTSANLKGRQLAFFAFRNNESKRG